MARYPDPNNDTLQKEFEKVLKEQNENLDEVYINLDFEVPADEISEVFKLALAVIFLKTTYEFPDPEEYKFVPDFVWFSKKMMDAISNIEADPLPLAFRVTEQEMAAAQYIFSQGMSIFARIEHLSNENANDAIRVESFRRRLLKAAHMEKSA